MGLKEMRQHVGAHFYCTKMLVDTRRWWREHTATNPHTVVEDSGLVGVALGDRSIVCDDGRKATVE